ncbi:MAG: hypothetical protein RIS48_591, partial [Pseudomonadota bacterium]
TATDDAIAFGLARHARYMVLVPCCQAEVASVLRCLELEAHGYQVTVTELVGWEHSMKNELILARKVSNAKAQASARERLQQVLDELGLQELQQRFGA